MSLRALLRLLVRDLARARGVLAHCAFGIAMGAAAMAFFLGLGLGVKKVLLGEVFPIDRVQLEPPKTADPGMLGGLLGFGRKHASISPESVSRLRDSAFVAAAYPKLRLAFPCSARGGKELLGRDIGTSEMIADGVDPRLVAGSLKLAAPFVDPLAAPGKRCSVTADCKYPRYCESPVGSDGVCVEPVPVLVSRYLVELFDKTVAPAHGFPAVGATLVERASGAVFRLWLGESLLGKSKRGAPRHIRARLVGVSPAAIDLGVTMPLNVVRRLNREFAGEGAAKNYSSVVVRARDKERMADVLAMAATEGLRPRDTRARDVSVLLRGVMGLLSLVALVILLVSASNIAYTFRLLVYERRRELALYRALGASAADSVRWLLGLALAVGVAGSALGVVLARLLALQADRMAAQHLPDFPFKPASFFSFEPTMVAVVALLATGCALLGALGPARAAAKLDPAAALTGGD